MLSPLVWQPLPSPSPPFVGFVGLGCRARFCSTELPPLVPILSAAVACYDGEKIMVVLVLVLVLVLGAGCHPSQPLSFVPRNLADSPLSAVPLLLPSTLKVFAPIQDP